MLFRSVSQSRYGSLGLVGCVGDSDADEGGVLEYQENCAGRYFVDEGGSSSSEVCDG